MQSVSSRIWAHVAMSISYDDNHYTTGTAKIIIIKVIFKMFMFKIFQQSFISFFFVVIISNFLIDFSDLIF